jgi:hypothetical protein
MIVWTPNKHWLNLVYGTKLREQYLSSTKSRVTKHTGFQLPQPMSKIAIISTDTPSGALSSLVLRMALPPEMKGCQGMGPFRGFLKMLIKSINWLSAHLIKSQGSGSAGRPLYSKLLTVISATVLRRNFAPPIPGHSTSFMVLP